MLPEALRNLPYLVHTNRELGLMLRGEKPLAYFMNFTERMPVVLARYLRLFDRNVPCGRLGKRVVPVETQAPPEFGKCQRTFYFLPGEEWRVDAMLSLLDRQRTSWSERHEREFGLLLGYEEWQCDVWLKGWKSPDRPSG